MPEGEAMGLQSQLVSQDANYDYHYDSNDQFRNNRPLVKKLVTEGNIGFKQPNARTTGNSQNEKTDGHGGCSSPPISLKTPRMPSTLDDFEVISTIGTGSYGTCKKIRRKKDGKVMVWKEMEYGSMTESEKQMLVSEVNLLRELRHQHIVRYYDRIIDRTRAVIYIIMEYCSGGDLASIISRNRKESSRVAEDFVWKILIQTTLALKECHSRKNGKAVLHRDLKPANVFLDAEANVKLGDFGLARVLQHEHSLAQTYVGTPYYMSPELVNNQSYNEKSDIWSLGCMLYELCALAPPFTASNEAELKRKIRIGDFPRLPSQYSIDLDMIIRRMIQVEVSKRPSIDSILLDSIVQRKQDSLNRRNGCAQGVRSSPTNAGAPKMNGSGDREGCPLAYKQEDVAAKMRQLEYKERELESRERSLAIREKLADDKMKRATEIMEQCKCRRDLSAGATSPRLGRLSPPCTEVIENVQPPPYTCLSNGTKTYDVESSKKQVTFSGLLNHGKENLHHKMLGLPSSYKASALYSGPGLNLPVRDGLHDCLLGGQEVTRVRRVGSGDLGAKYTPRKFGLLHFR